MVEISTKLIKEAVYKLCFDSNTCLNYDVYQKLYSAYKFATNDFEKAILKSILQNAKIAYEKKMPLCQDTGQVIVFLEIGQNVQIIGEYLGEAINQAVEDCYRENCFRKSVVENALFNRKNTSTNTPVIIHSEIVKGDKIKLKILIKGAGSENKSQLLMELPTTEKSDLVKKIGDLIISTGVNACPPMFIGIGFGSCAENALLLSKKAIVSNEFSEEELKFAEEIKNYVNENSQTDFKQNYVLSVNVLTSFTHIACLPVGICINCHSNRTAACEIVGNQIIYDHKIPNFAEISDEIQNCKEVFSDDIEGILNLKRGENILLSGEIYVARDMAHKKICEMIKNNEKLPFDIKNKIIFYAGPCPDKSDSVFGSIGPTTANRMDKYAIELYNRGVIATIGKGDRNESVKETISKNNAKYFSMAGGVAALMAQKILKKEIIAFDELGPEAVYRLIVSKMPVKVEIS